MADLLPPTRTVDIAFQQGDDTPALIEVPDEDGSPMRVVGWSAVAVVVANGREVHRWSTADGSAVCGPDGIELLVDDSAAWSWHRGRWDLRVTAPDGTRRVVAAGDMVVRPVRSR